MWRPWKDVDHSASGSANLKRKYLSPDAKQIVKNVYVSLLNREFNVNAAAAETSSLTKTPLSTVKDIVTKQIKDKKVRSDAGKSKCFDESDKDLIRRKMYAMYEEQIVPTLVSLKQRLMKDETNISCSRTSLWRVLSQMGFTYRIINKRQILMESQRLRQWRFDYLKSIKKYRLENRPIIYLDETWFDTHDTPAKGWVDPSGKCQTKAPSNKGKRITILHAGSEDGWVPNSLWLSSKNIKDSSLDYHDDTTAELFEDWFKNHLLPNVPKNSVIVMDNASYHSRQINKVPNSNNTKLEIQNYMLKNYIYFENTYKKCDLLGILKTFNIKKECVCDTIATDMGHTVLRLPPYYCIFNPIEHMWHQVKSNVRTENTSPTLSASVVTLIRKVIDSIPIESWKNSINHVIKVEDSYFSFSNDIEPLVINVDENDSDSETELNL